MFDMAFMRRLSSKLLVLTVIFVMFAELVIFIPSAALFRQTWLAERAEAAGLLTLAIEGVPNYEGGEMLSTRFMQDTDVIMVAQKRGGMSQVVLGMPPPDCKIILADLRTERRLPLFRDSFRDFFSDGTAVIRILSAPTVEGVDALEILVPQSALKRDLLDYCARVLLWSLIISLLTGLMIYAALALIIVRPIRKLAKGLGTFREDPRKRARIENPTTRRDEIGQLEREFLDMKSGVRTALKQQERLATLGMAMAKINHDLRNVLTSTGLISDRLASDPEARIKTMGERLVRSVERGVNLCEATLSFSQSAQEKPNPQPVHIKKLLDEAAADSLAEQSEVTFINNVPASLFIMADLDHTYRIFHNIFRNAVQAMRTRSKQELRISTSQKNGKACIFVQDTGPGIPPDLQQDLFKAFTTGKRDNKDGGTGLGLTISRELARAQGGNLTLKETNANGTTFVIELPMAAGL